MPHQEAKNIDKWAALAQRKVDYVCIQRVSVVYFYTVRDVNDFIQLLYLFLPGVSVLVRLKGLFLTDE